MVERVLAALAALAEKMRRHANDRERRMAAKLDTEYQLDGCRADRAAAKEKLEQWEAGHRWQVVTSRAFGGGDGARSKPWQSLLDAFEVCQRRLQPLKAALRSHQVHLDAFAEEEAALKVEQANSENQLRTAVGNMLTVEASSLSPLLEVANEFEKAWVQTVMPTPAVEELAPVTPLVIAAAQLRPARRVAP